MERLLFNVDYNDMETTGEGIHVSGAGEGIHVQLLFNVDYNDMETTGEGIHVSGAATT